MVERVVFEEETGRWWWRTLDLGYIAAYLEADAPRERCPDHGVTVVAFPWARHRARHTSVFEDQCAWLAAHCSRSAVEERMRVAWRTWGRSSVGWSMTLICDPTRWMGFAASALTRSPIRRLLARSCGFGVAAVSWR